MPKSVCIIGGGAWGLALYSALSPRIETKIYSRRHLKDVKQVCWEQMSSTTDETLFILAISSAHIRPFLQSHHLPRNTKILVVAKGIEEETGAFLSEIMELYFERNTICYLGGPSFAKEVAKGLPCAVVIHSYHDAIAHEFTQLFPSFMRVYHSHDVIGGEIAGAYKNVIAIASGICEGLELGQNAKSSLLARGLVEMERFGRFFGAETETFLGLSGAGDLFLTSNSTLSRNFRVGLGLAKKQNIDAIIQELGEVAEGIKTSRAIFKRAQQHDIYTPIAREVVHVINGKDALESLKTLLHTKQKRSDLS